VQQLDMKTLNMQIALIGLKHSFPAIVSQFGQGTRFGFLQCPKRGISPSVEAKSILATVLLLNVQ
jgi:hypothetical protein